MFTSQHDYLVGIDSDGCAFDTIGNRRQTLAGGDQNGGNQRSAAYTVNNLNQYTQRTVPGYADILVTPDIQAGNILYKCMTQLAGATVAAMVIGTSAPVILTSRTDTDDAKFYSIVLAALMAK